MVDVRSDMKDAMQIDDFIAHLLFSFYWLVPFKSCDNPFN